MEDRRALEEVAEPYRRQGYRVALRPHGSDLPPFLSAFQPDLIAEKNGEKAVVQIKERTEDLKGDRALVHFAGVVNAEPGWRFDLVVLNPPRWPEEVPSEAADADAERLADEAGKLVNLQLLPSALVTAWAAVEAALRATAHQLGIALERNDARFVLNTLYSEGVLSRSDFDRLQATLRQRNAAVHGLQTNGLQSADVQFLIDFTRRLPQEQALVSH